MSFSRVIAPSNEPSNAKLTAAMVGIGMRFAARGAVDPNIEDTLFFASVEAMERDDLRVLALVATWFGVHARWVNADRLTKLVETRGSLRVRALWSALAYWQGKDRRFVRLAAAYEGPRVDVPSSGSAFLIRKHGEDLRFKNGPLRVAANVLRDRPGDVLAPRELARRHRVYRARVQMGPSYRADAWAALEEESTLSAAELARRAYASFATAWQVRREFDILNGASSR